MPVISRQAALRRVVPTLFALTLPVWTYWLTFDRGLETLRKGAHEQIEAIVSELFVPTEKHAYLPRLVAKYPTILSAVLDSGNPKKIHAANLLLAAVKDDAKAEAVYVLDRDGTAIASSNWDSSTSYVGHNFSFRPYTKDALLGREGRFYALGNISRIPGYFLSYPLRDKAQIIGIVVAKVDLTSLDGVWARSVDFDVTVSDEHGIIFLSNRSDWKYRPLAPLDEHHIQQLQDTKKYGHALRPPLQIEYGSVKGGARIAQVAGGQLTSVEEPIEYLVEQRKLEGSPWTVSVFNRVNAVRATAFRLAAAVAAVLATVGISLLYWQEMRKRVSERTAAQHSMEVSHERFRIVAKATSDVVWDWDLQNDLLSWNENMRLTFGHPPEELEPGGDSWGNRIHVDDRQRVLEGIHRVIDGDSERWSDEYRFLCHGGRVAHVFDRGFVIRNGNGKAIRMVGSITDISHRKEAEQEIHRLAYYDLLTGLPNRSHLLDRLRATLSTKSREQAIGAVLFIDLDNFKALNDTLGHHKGDLMLAQVALRLKECVRESDTLGRLGGDEFVIMLDRLSPRREEATTRAKVVAQKVLDAFADPFELEGVHWHTSPSIGISLFETKDTDPDNILKQADMAMYAAKADGRNTLAFFAPQMELLAQARAAKESDLRRALAEDELLLHFQPQCDPEGRVQGVEALIRWQHPTQGLVSPNEFIPMAEQTGLIVPIGYWVLRQACQQLLVWACDSTTADLTIAVNVSAHQFHRADFVAQVETILTETGVDARRLKLELTESALISDVEDAIDKMHRIRALGATFSLDDFGTGYSSLAYLHRLPISQLKIDRSFVAQVPGDSNGAAIVNSIIALGKTLGLSVIAEGVETEDQLAFLAAGSCDSYQGYLFGHPVPIQEFSTVFERM